MADMDKLIGANVARARGGTAQQELADKMRDLGFRWSQATVWEVEKGKRPLRLAEAWELSKVLKCSMESLILPTEQARFLAHLQGWESRMLEALLDLRSEVRDFLSEQRELVNEVEYCRRVFPSEWQDPLLRRRAEEALDYLASISTMTIDKALETQDGEHQEED